MQFSLLQGTILFAKVLRISFACMAVNIGDSADPPSNGAIPLAQPICSKCPAIYYPNCNGLKDRHRCLTSAQAQVHRTEVPGRSCIFTYKCPEPTLAYAWPKTGGGPQEIKEKLYCTAPKPMWRTANLRPISRISCMSRPETRCGGCVDIYETKSPCLRDSCAARKDVSLRVFRDPSNNKRCLLEFECPSGTVPYIFEGVAKGYVKASTNPITCTDNGPGSSWNTMLAPPFEDAYVNHVSCFSET
ncbi:hypothetical protein Aduo_016529 [Ancylostoma duodenale]